MSEAARPLRPARSRTARAEPGSAKVSILVADDHAFVREGMRALIESEEDMVVVGEAHDGRQAVAMAARLRPDVLVVDIAMPLLNGIEATRQILAALPATRVLVLSAHSDDEYVERVMELGAAGYVLKQSSLEDLATAIRTVWAGRSFLSPSIARRVRRCVRGHALRLTPRERELLRFVAEGRADRQTAAKLRISIKTVEKHRKSLMTKLDIHDVADLTRYAIAVGSITGRDRIATR